MAINRRDFIKNIASAAGGVFFLTGRDYPRNDNMFFDISLAEWSLHRTLRSGEISNLDFPIVARDKYGIHAVEYVSTFFKSTRLKYLAELRDRTVNEGIDNVLIMVDAEGNLGDTDPKKRDEAVENHLKWIETAHYLGCHTIRVNARGEGSREEVAKAAIDGLAKLAEQGAHEGINVVVENHGGYSSDGNWLSEVIRKVDMPNCGTLPDFGNFNISADKSYDRYKGTKQLMPYAKGVSAKTRDFDKKGNEKTMDYERLLKIVKQGNYRGYIGIEYEGSNLSEEQGIKASKKMLEKVGKKLS